MIKKHTMGLNVLVCFSVASVNARNVFGVHGKQV